MRQNNNLGKGYLRSVFSESPRLKRLVLQLWDDKKAVDGIPSLSKTSTHASIHQEALTAASLTDRTRRYLVSRLCSLGPILPVSS